MTNNVESLLMYYLFLNIIISSLRNTRITPDSPPMVLDGVMTHLIENTSEEVCKSKGGYPHKAGGAAMLPLHCEHPFW